MSTLQSTINVVVRSIDDEGKSNRSFILESESGEYLPSFEPGSHIDVYISEGIIRQYSLAGPPAKLDSYLICVKREIDSQGGSVYLHEKLKVGDLLAISAPRNCFPVHPAKRYILVAGGIGITPILSIAEYLDSRQIPFVLHYYFKSEAEAAFISKLSQRFSTREVILHDSSYGDSLRNDVPEDIYNVQSESRIYVCGPEGFIDRLKIAALDNQWSEDQFHSEYFKRSTQESSEQEKPFEVELSSSGHVFYVPANYSIAQVLIDSNIPVSLSCEQGMCGACLTKVLSGIPEHRDTVQSESEKSSNSHITICCSRSLTERLVLDI